MNDIYSALYEMISKSCIINTHSHHLSDDKFLHFSLNEVLRESYINWSKVDFTDTEESRNAYLEKVRYNSYFVWLQKSLQDLYCFDEPITAANWDDLSNRIQMAYQNPSHHIEILKRRCHYQKVIVDTYWDPGSDNGHPELFSPTFRVDPFFYGYSQNKKDHDGNNANHLYGVLPNSLPGFIKFLHDKIVEKKEEGCVAIKAAIAYDRGLDIQPATEEQASVVFQKTESEWTDQDIKHFQDYLFLRICEFAAELHLPLQCHTGMGQLKNTRPSALQYAIEKNPQTQFVLFHCGFPWTDDVNALLHFFPNVYVDLCWLPILSPTVAERVIHELIEVATADKILWGCDTWTSEESYGAFLAMRQVFSNAFTRKIENNYFSLDDAKNMIQKILHDNAQQLYFQSK